MPCDTVRVKGETLSERKKAVLETVRALEIAVIKRQVKAVVGPQGSITFAGWTNKNGVTDACAYRRLMATGSALAKVEIARAEQIAGRGIDRSAVNAGIHSHDGTTWHNKG